MEHSIKVAVVGTGSIGMTHLATLQKINGVLPIAVSKRADQRARLAASGFLVASDFQEAHRLGSTHAIVASDTGLHLPDCIAVLESGGNLLVEKPVAPSAKLAAELAVYAKAKKRNAAVGNVLRFSRSLRQFREELPKIGDRHFVRIECQSYLPDWRPNRPYRESYSARGDEGGVLRDLIHEIDYAGWIFGWPHAVQARLRNLEILRIASEEIAELQWESTDGALISISLDYLSRISRRRMRAEGRLGSLEWDGVAGTVTLHRPGQSAHVLAATQTRDEMFLEQAKAFLGGGESERPADMASLEDGVRALAVCDAARRSSEYRREEKVDYPPL